MKLELKENMYYRTYSGFINKITSIKDYNEREYLLNGFYVNKKNTIKKASYNIIDVLEVGDYVNGYKITEIIEKPRKCLKTEYKINLSYVFFCFYEKDIKSIITYEQMEQMAYKVVE